VTSREKKLAVRIEELEKRVKELEARPPSTIVFQYPAYTFVPAPAPALPWPYTVGTTDITWTCGQ
jgi:hypothetical protein